MFHVLLPLSNFTLVNYSTQNNYGFALPALQALLFSYCVPLRSPLIKAQGQMAQEI